MRSIYFDYNATTPLDPRVREAMSPFWSEDFGNPSSIHHVGRRARVALDEARERTAAVFTCKPSEIVFTSGGTESSNLAIFGVARLKRDQGRHIITSAIEHHAVLHPCEYLRRKEGFEITCVPVDSNGRVSPMDVARVIRPDTVLVSIMAANNEIGTLQPVAEIGQICRERSVLFHTDAVQWFGKEPFTSILQFNADLVSICAHKFHGPKGAGALYVRSPLLPDPILFGGSHENERRAGTENIPAIMGFVVALEQFVKSPVFSANLLSPLTLMLSDSLSVMCGVHLHSPCSGRLCNTIGFSVSGCDSLSLLAGLDLAGICASSGAACSAGSLESSHVLLALGQSPALARSFVRFSLGRHSNVAEVQYCLSQLPMIFDRIREPNNLLISS